MAFYANVCPNSKPLHFPAIEVQAPAQISLSSLALRAPRHATGKGNPSVHSRRLNRRFQVLRPRVEHNAGRTEALSKTRRRALQSVAMAAWVPPWVRAQPVQGSRAPPANPKTNGPTNEVVRVVNGMRHKRLGAGDIFVSEMGLGTQRWGSADFNAPDKALCHRLMDRAVLEAGVNLIDTAEQYPIPSSRARPEGSTERIIGQWLALDPSRREQVVLASKITGGMNVTPRNLRRDVEASLQRLQTHYLDVYLLHWPARYTPQANWGQSLMYDMDAEKSTYYQGHATFDQIAQTMGELIAEGKILGWGMCNDNAYGLAASCAAARAPGVPKPVAMQNDFSLIDRRAEENGVTEGSSPFNENVGFMAYNALAGGVLTGKYLDVPAVPDDDNLDRARQNYGAPRGRMDDLSWGRTLYRYRSGPALEAVMQYSALASDYEMSLTELSLRWCRERQGLTSVLVGQTSMAQLEEDLAAFTTKDALNASLMWDIDRVHMRNRLPIFSSYDVGADWNGSGQIGERIP
mmetsp:Transcript_43744/g.81786  ORF Transcript_43744/g.81786 Transcript_43744/m.81786 type:complete len:519 (-) Transcript_43744:427-1983(-)